MSQAAPGPAESVRRRHLVYFSFDCANEGITRRLKEALRAGYEITMFSFHRIRNDTKTSQFVERAGLRNIDLGKVPNGAYVMRMSMMLRALLIILRHRDEVRRADIIVTRNLDMGLLTIAVRALFASRVPLIYEVLDIRSLLTRKDLAGRIARAAENMILRRTRMLIVSSPGFLRNYFEVFFKRLPAAMVIENKISLSGEAALPEKRAPLPLDAANPVWTIGWFGKLRCRVSLRLLTGLARKMPDRIRIHIRGYPDAISGEELAEAIKGLPNVDYGGSYRTPADLPEMMAQIHLNWCIDLHDHEANSRWLLPNRIYEGGYFGIAAIALDGTETGDYVRKNGLGYVLPSADPEELERFIRDLDPQAFNDLRASLAAEPARFVDDGAFPHMLDDILAGK